MWISTIYLNIDYRQLSLLIRRSVAFPRAQSHTNVFQFRRWRGAELSTIKIEDVQVAPRLLPARVGTCNSFVRPFETQSARSCRLSTIEAYRTLNLGRFARRRYPVAKKKKTRKRRGSTRHAHADKDNNNLRQRERPDAWTDGKVADPRSRVILYVHIWTQSAITRDNRCPFQRNE